MSWFIFIILLAVTIALAGHILRLRRLLRELDDAVRSQRRVLPEESSSALRRLGALSLIESMNQLIDSHTQTAVINTGFSNQAEAILGAVQEVVIIFNDEHIVEYANRAAEELFKEGGSIKDQRLESVLRSLSLLEMLNAAEAVERTESKHIQIEQGVESLWFEATCSKVKGGGAQELGSTVLVMHDITKLKTLESMRREFVANVSHELRTPLTIIKGFAEALIDDEATIDPKSRNRFTTKILRNSERLHVLVEDILTLSRLESRPDQIERIEQPLASMLEEVAENYRSRLSGKGQSIWVSIDKEVTNLSFDRYRIQQVLDNFMENTFRYAPDFTCIKLEAKLDSQDGRFVRCSVTDDGPGIPEKDLPHIFERFYRVDKGRSRETGGTGLGLSIVKHIIQLHGGSVAAESTVGVGTRMSFTLPISSDL